MKIIFVLIATTLCSVHFKLNAQFEPDYNNNYFTEVAYWEGYFDSIADLNESLGNNYARIEGYNDFNRWRAYWDRYMPQTGNYDDAFEIYKQNDAHLKHIHLQSIQSNGGQIALSVPPVSWQEIGPKNGSDILRNYSGNWENPHLNNSGTEYYNGHVGKIDRLFQHPANSNIIYACAGGIPNACVGRMAAVRPNRIAA